MKNNKVKSQILKFVVFIVPVFSLFKELVKWVSSCNSQICRDQRNANKLGVSSLMVMKLHQHDSRPGFISITWTDILTSLDWRILSWTIRGCRGDVQVRDMRTAGVDFVKVSIQFFHGRVRNSTTTCSWPSTVSYSHDLLHLVRRKIIIYKHLATKKYGQLSILWFHCCWFPKPTKQYSKSILHRCF